MRPIIDLMIETANQLYKDAQLQEGYKESYEGADEKNTIETSKSIGGAGGGEIVEENNSNDLERSKSAPPRSLPHPGKLEQIRKLQDALRRLKRNIKHMNSLQQDVDEELRTQFSKLGPMVGNSTNRVHNDFESITKTLLELMNKKTVSPGKRINKKKLSSDHHKDDDNFYLPGIHENEEDLRRLAVFRQVRDEFKNLETDRQICLLSFAIFPENQEVNRTMLMYWWIGESILPVSGAEDAAKKILNDFTKKKLIEPVENKRKVEPSSYKMTPFVHCSVVLISKETGLFDMYHKGEKPSMRKSKLNKVCLVEGSSRPQEAKAIKMRAHDIETVFNVSERFPDFTFKWFSDQPMIKKFGPLSKTTYKALKVFYLGRWERSGRVIEVDSRLVMKNLSSMRRLRFLSFQGILTIKRLSRSACKLTELIILDLRGCDNLERLPENIHKLKSLVYLDLTGCKALESIPIGLDRLSNLEVLKGFVVTDEREIACKLNAIKGLSKLRKLSVTVDREDFGLPELIAGICDFEALEKLKVLWGSGLSLRKKPLDSQGEDKNKMNVNLPKRLKKLDLQRFPDKELPECLWPDNITGLEKLHLGSSRRLKGLSGSPPINPSRCSVKVLRLRCLRKLKVEWRDLKQLYFPKLNFLECYQCPRVTFCPCDRDGIWRSHE